MKIFSSRLKQALRGHKQSDIANKIGIGQPNLSMYANCENKPSLEVFRALCVSLGVNSDWLLGLTDERAGVATVTATGGSAVAAQSPGAKVSSHAPAPSLDTTRLLSIIESQQRVIEALSGSKK